ncbi:MAG: hypothetical protein AAF908_01525 [Pseudomonadota bacterium]
MELVIGKGRAVASTFLKAEDGAVTIDWVALTAGTLLLGIALVYGVFNQGVDPLGAEVSATLIAIDNDIEIGPAPELNNGS